MPTARGSCLCRAVPMRQMDVVSGLINVLTGLCFGGSSNERSLHKKGGCGESGMGWWDLLFILSPKQVLHLFASRLHSNAVSIGGWSNQTYLTWRSARRYFLPECINGSKVSQTLYMHKFIMKHNGTPQQGGKQKMQSRPRSGLFIEHCKTHH